MARPYGQDGEVVRKLVQNMVPTPMPLLGIVKLTKS